MLKTREYPKIGERALTDELPNGLKLTVVPKPGYRKNLAFLAVNYGGVDRRFYHGGRWVETPAGTAHFLEHKMFELEGEEDALTTLSERGAIANAFTSGDMTAYHFECTDCFFENLELLLRFVSTPYLTDESVERERGIIAQEIKMMEDDPDDVLYYGLLRSLYRHSPIRESVAGTAESIQKITAETLALCHRAFYTPANMALVVVGNADPKKIRETAMRILPEVNALPTPRDRGGRESPDPVDVRAERAMDVGAPLFLAGAKTAPELFGPESVRFELTATLALSSLMGRASPLYRALYDEGLVNETFGYDFENSCGVSHLSFGGETQHPDTVCLRVLEEAASLAVAGIDEKYFQRRKKSTYGGAIRALNSFDSLCYNIAAAAFNGYDYFETLDILEGITSDDARSFLAEYVTPEKTAISIIYKKER